VIATTGGFPRVTVIAAVVESPYGLVQATVMLFAPSESETALPLVLPTGLPLTEQVCSDGMLDCPLTVKLTLVEALVVCRPLTGDVIATTGVTPRVTVTLVVLLSPKGLLQSSVKVLAPRLRATLFVVALVVATLLILHV
jgi:hypothetical protein